VRKATIRTVFLLVMAASAFGGNPKTENAPRCKGNPAVIGACFTVRGRLSAWNGNPTFRIWPIGTKRMLGVREEFDLPSELDPHLGHFDDVVYANFEVCPLTAARAGAMQIVCVESARNIKKTTRER